MGLMLGRVFWSLFDIVDEMKGHVGGGSGVWRVQGVSDPIKPSSF
jgi:hypothetical protein